MNKIYLKFKNLDAALTLKFIIVGIIGFGVNYIGLKFFINAYGANEVVAEAVATIIALQITFILHNSWTYNNMHEASEHYKLSVKQRYMAFISSNIVGSLMTIIAFAITTNYINNKLIALGVAATLGTTWNYFANLLFTWKHLK